MSQASRARAEARRLAITAATGRPRNPTASDRWRGEPPLSAAEWALLRTWQKEQLRQYTDTPTAVARRWWQDNIEMHSGTPWTAPVHLYGDGDEDTIDVITNQGHLC